jgi:RNA polymerase sigma-70 factor (ECF subfamily)
MAARDVDADVRSVIERLFRSHYTGLVAFATRVTGNTAEAEDLVQDVFLGLWRRRTELPAEDAVRPYLYRAAHNRALNVVRNRRVAEAAAERELIEAQMEAQTAAAAADLEADELARLVESAIARLPERCRMVFLLSRENGLSYAEIAGTLGISVKTVETQMGRALKFLRAELAAFVS